MSVRTTLALVCSCLISTLSLAKTDVLFFFDAEDFVSNRSHDAIRDLANILSEEGVRGQFALSGYLAKKLVDRRRTDVLDALRNHLVGSQTLYHSVHPNLTELTDLQDFNEAYRLALAQESEAVGMIKAATGHERIWCSVFPGNGQSYVGLYLYADMEVPFFGGCSDIYRGDGRGRGSVWCCNQRHIPYHGAFPLEGFLTEEGLSEKEISAGLDRAAKLEVVPRDQLGDIGKDLPGLVGFRQNTRWIYGPDFRDDYLSDRLRWQFWTLRYE